jgi:hypothetical protein
VVQNDSSVVSLRQQITNAANMYICVCVWKRADGRKGRAREKGVHETHVRVCVQGKKIKEKVVSLPCLSAL